MSKYRIRKKLFKIKFSNIQKHLIQILNNLPLLQFTGHEVEYHTRQKCAKIKCFLLKQSTFQLSRVIHNITQKTNGSQHNQPNSHHQPHYCQECLLIFYFLNHNQTLKLFKNWAPTYSANVVTGAVFGTCRFFCHPINIFCNFKTGIYTRTQARYRFKFNA